MGVIGCRNFAISLVCAGILPASESIFYQCAIEKFGGVDIFVANAGIASRGSTVRDTPSGEFLALFNTHVMGTVWSTKAVLDSMRERGAGRIDLEANE